MVELAGILVLAILAGAEFSCRTRRLGHPATGHRLFGRVEFALPQITVELLDLLNAKAHLQVHHLMQAEYLGLGNPAMVGARAHDALERAVIGKANDIRTGDVQDFCRLLRRQVLRSGLGKFGAGCWTHTQDHCGAVHRIKR